MLSMQPTKSRCKYKTKRFIDIYLAAGSSWPCGQDGWLAVVRSPVRTLPPREYGGALVVWPGMPFPNLDGRIHQSLVFTQLHKIISTFAGIWRKRSGQCGNALCIQTNISVNSLRLGLDLQPETLAICHLGFHKFAWQQFPRNCCHTILQHFKTLKIKL